MTKILTVFSAILIATISLAQNINSFPYTTGFEGIEGNLHSNYPEGWTSEDLNTNTSGNQPWQIIKNSESYTNARTDSTAVHMLSNMTQVNNDWLYTPGIEMSAGITYTLSFWYNTIDFGGTSEKLKIHIGNDAISTAMDVDALWDNNNISNLAYLEAVIDYTPTSDGVYYFGFHYYSDDFQYILLIDDVTISESSTSILENSTVSECSVYPNPCNSDLNLSVSNSTTDNKQINIFDTAGKLIISESFHGSNFKINTAKLKTGTYIIQLYINENNIITKKISVEH